MRQEIGTILGDVARSLIGRPQRRTRLFTPQQVRVRAPLAETFAAMTSFGGGKGKPGENYSEILEHDEQRYVVRFTTFSWGRTIVTREEVCVYPPSLITYRHLEGPLADVFEVIVAQPLSPERTLVRYLGEYRLSKNDLPFVGWLLHRLVVLPQYEAIIAKHLAHVKERAERRRAISGGSGVNQAARR